MSNVIADLAEVDRGHCRRMRSPTTFRKAAIGTMSLASRCKDVMNADLIHQALILSAVMVLAACGESEPLDEDAAQAAYEQQTNGLPAASNSSADVERLDLQWFIKVHGRTALYGPPAGEGRIALRCQENEMGNNRLVFDWNISASPDNVETVTMGWGNDTETFEVEARDNQLMPTGQSWTATFDPTGKEANFLLAAISPITFTMGEVRGGTITVPADDILKRAIQSCQPM